MGSFLGYRVGESAKLLGGAVRQVRGEPDSHVMEVLKLFENVVKSRLDPCAS